MKNKIIFLICLIVFVVLQFSKPTVFMEIYRLATDFNPPLHSNWQLYKSVWNSILLGTMATKITLPVLIGEIVFALAPLALHKELSKPSSIQPTP